MSPILCVNNTARGPLKFTFFQTQMESQLIVRTKKSRRNRPTNPQNRTVILTNNKPTALGASLFGQNPYGVNTNQVKFTPTRQSNKLLNRTRQSSQIWQSPSLTRNKSLAAKGSTKNTSSPRTRRSLLLEEDEYIGEVSSNPSNTFQVDSFPVNIGQSKTFPWGSGVAKNNFEKYIFEYLEFYFKREVSEFAPNGSSGKVILSFISDASAGLPSNKQQMEDTFPHSDGMPSENIRLVIPSDMLKRLNDGHFIRPGGLPGSADIKTYDLGQFFIASQGITNASALLGELHVKYKCRVFYPILEGPSLAPVNTRVAAFYVSTAGEAITSDTQYTVQFASADPVNGLSAVNTAGNFVLPVGNYLVSSTLILRVAGGDSIGTALAAIYIGVTIYYSPTAGSDTAGGTTVNMGRVTIPQIPMMWISDGVTPLSCRFTDQTTFTGAGQCYGSIMFVQV